MPYCSHYMKLEFAEEKFMKRHLNEHDTLELLYTVNNIGIPIIFTSKQFLIKQLLPLCKETGMLWQQNR